MSFLSILPVVILAINSIKSEEKVLNIMGLLPMTGEKWPGGAACLTASEMAARHINERHDVLKEFTLDLYLQDGAVSVDCYYYPCFRGRGTLNVIMGRVVSIGSRLLTLSRHD